MTLLWARCVGAENGQMACCGSTVNKGVGLADDGIMIRLMARFIVVVLTNVSKPDPFLRVRHSRAKYYGSGGMLGSKRYCGHIRIEW